jgi:hypothetical protein
VEVERAIARQELESDKLSNRAGEQSDGTLQDLRFWKTRRAGTRKSRSVGIRKDGTDGEGVSWWERGGRQLSCRVVSWSWRWLTVFEEFWYRSLGHWC